MFQSILKIIISIITLTTTLAIVSTPLWSEPAGQSKSPLQSKSLEQKWQLTSITNGNNVYKGSHLGFIQFDNGNIEGQSTCNGYSGVYSLKDNQHIEIYRIGSTQLICNIDNKMQIEAEYIEGLENSTSYKIENDNLILYSPQKKEFARFKKSSTK